MNNPPGTKRIDWSNRALLTGTVRRNLELDFGERFVKHQRVRDDSHRHPASLTVFIVGLTKDARYPAADFASNGVTARKLPGSDPHPVLPIHPPARRSWAEELRRDAPERRDRAPRR